MLTCSWHGSGWLSSVLSAYSCNRLKTSRLRTASCRNLRFVSGELLLRCANCHSIYFESMKSLRTALSITLNILVHLLLGIKMSVTFNRCKKISISAMPTSSLQVTDGKRQHNWSSHWCNSPLFSWYYVGQM